MILQPQKNFTVVRKLSNHTDATTYYVRAVVRNALTDDILATLNLVKKTGEQRYAKDWQVPADASGQGLQITIETSVYIDSDYSIKSDNYGDEITDHVIRNDNRRLGGGGGVDAYTIRTIIQDELDKRKPAPIEFPEIPTPKEYEMRWDEVFGAVAEVRDAIDRIPKTDLTPVYNRLDTLERAINEKEVTPPTDLTPVLEKLNEVSEVGEVNHNDAKDNLEAMEEVLKQTIKAEIHDAISTTKFISQFSTAAVTSDTPKRDTASGPMFDLKKLAS